MTKYTVTVCSDNSTRDVGTADVEIFEDYTEGTAELIIRNADLTTDRVMSATVKALTADVEYYKNARDEALRKLRAEPEPPTNKQKLDALADAYYTGGDYSGGITAFLDSKGVKAP